MLLFVPSVAFGVYADAYYYRDAKDKIAAASDFNDPTALLDHLRKKGGVHTWVLWLSIALPVFGIFASILIPRFLTTISL